VTTAAQSDEGDADPEVVHVDVSPARLRSMMWRFIGVVVLVMAVLGALGLVYGEALTRFAEGFVRVFGAEGVFFGWLIADVAPLPIPHDVISTAGVLGGLGFWTVVAVASAGSITGSCIGFAIGRYLSHTRWFAWVMRRYGAESRALAERYGVAALIIGAVTPVNYSVVVWAAGAMQLRWSQHLSVAWMRIPRVVVYLFLFTRVFEGS